MVEQTLYLIQAFSESTRGRLLSDAPIRCISERAARRGAEILAGTKAGVMAISMHGDFRDAGSEMRTEILFSAGRIPEELGLF
ncbi:hypothetical protein SAMN02745172_00003 [Pseudoxanthobacter soli DSM 19599]|uniref:Uncharacterized protein n=1 Tax=Pseudoxanthobacter soli DSM 19599 TaxID=1123029 RepID=A0A1M7Z3T8_9HYPH|nr:hypothetical protein [Pseudoxanthobacter soli]SHO59617.1 hypothetical protein SAMN02745172_00003 [Pseudoxanthobacter soli DSM 19599]